MRLPRLFQRSRKPLVRDRRPRPSPWRPSLEQLEDRLVPSTLDINAFGNATYLSSTGPADNLTLSERFIILPRVSPSPQAVPPPIKIIIEDVLTDSSQKITVTGAGAAG